MDYSTDERRTRAGAYDGALQVEVAAGQVAYLVSARKPHDCPPGRYIAVWGCQVLAIDEALAWCRERGMTVLRGHVR